MASKTCERCDRGFLMFEYVADTPMGEAYHVNCSVCGPVGTIHWEEVRNKLMEDLAVERFGRV